MDQLHVINLLGLIVLAAFGPFIYVAWRNALQSDAKDAPHEQGTGTLL